MKKPRRQAHVGEWRNEGTTDQTKETIASSNLPRSDSGITFVDHMIRLRAIEEEKDRWLDDNIHTVSNII